MAAGRTDVKYGALYENAVAQELYSRRQNRHAPLYYFKNDRIGEIDFLITDVHDCVVPLEVKSGKSYKRHSALDNVLKTANYDIEQAYVLCEDNISTDGSVAYLPIYMIMFIGI
jgi:hypothetical protein